MVTSSASYFKICPVDGVHNLIALSHSMCCIHSCSQFQLAQLFVVVEIVCSEKICDILAMIFTARTAD